MNLGSYEILEIIRDPGNNEPTFIESVLVYYDRQNNEICRVGYTNPDNILSGYSPKNTPVKVTRWQLRSQLALMPSTNPLFSNLREEVDSAIAGLTGSTKIVTEEAWNNSPYIDRYSPTVSLMSGALNLTASEVDQIFIDAYNISA